MSGNTDYGSKQMKNDTEPQGADGFKGCRRTLGCKYTDGHPSFCEQHPILERSRTRTLEPGDVVVPKAQRQAEIDAMRLARDWITEVLFYSGGADSATEDEYIQSRGDEALDALRALPVVEVNPVPVAHVCGVQGYDGMIDPPCPGCDHE